jgi:hypothetical protein
LEAFSVGEAVVIFECGVTVTVVVVVVMVTVVGLEGVAEVKLLNERKGDVNQLDLL